MSLEVKTCPSAPALPGVNLLGVVRADSTVGLLQYPLPITPRFIEEASAHGTLEKQFRFSAPCVETGCSQWKEGGCGVIRKLSGMNPDVPEATLPKCIIRPTCRWFAQEGSKACQLCKFVVTESREDAIGSPLEESAHEHSLATDLTTKGV